MSHIQINNDYKVYKLDYMHQLYLKESDVGVSSFGYAHC